MSAQQRFRHGNLRKMCQDKIFLQAVSNSASALPV